VSSLLLWSPVEKYHGGAATRRGRNVLRLRGRSVRCTQQSTVLVELSPRAGAGRSMLPMTVFTVPESYAGQRKTGSKVCIEL
jgi:hypothetical protein